MFRVSNSMFVECVVSKRPLTKLTHLMAIDYGYVKIMQLYHHVLIQILFCFYLRVLISFHYCSPPLACRARLQSIAFFDEISDVQEQYKSVCWCAMQQIKYFSCAVMFKLHSVLHQSLTHL